MCLRHHFASSQVLFCGHERFGRRGSVTIGARGESCCRFWVRWKCTAGAPKAGASAHQALNKAGLHFSLLKPGVVLGIGSAARPRFKYGPHTSGASLHGDLYCWDHVLKAAAVLVRLEGIHVLHDVQRLHQGQQRQSPARDFLMVRRNDLISCLRRPPCVFICHLLLVPVAASAFTPTRRRRRRRCN
jgi:hypothetical protein